MSIRSSLAGLALPVAVLALSAVDSQAQPRPSPQPPVASPAPAIQAGEFVFDRSGQQVGTVQGLVETTAGPMVVALIDGKLISLPQQTLKVEGKRVVSSQSKAQMVAAARAPAG